MKKLDRALGLSVLLLLAACGRTHVFGNGTDSGPDGDGVPRFVEKARRAFLRCGLLPYGFARFACEACSDPSRSRSCRPRRSSSSGCSSRRRTTRSSPRRPGGKGRRPCVGGQEVGPVAQTDRGSQTRMFRSSIRSMNCD